MKQFLKKLLIILAIAAAVAAPFFVWSQRQALHDWWRLRGYEPPTQVVMLADDTTMTDYGRKLFYVNHPSLQDKDAFNSSCYQTEESIVLGCYIEGNGIYLYDVKDPRLNGILEVTAAHEMLHAGYDRLSEEEKSHINKLLEEAFQNLNNERIHNTIERYRKRDPSIVPNELHSILGTEVRELPEELEEYYRRYFVDRLAVVGFSEQYENEFMTRRRLVQQYDDELAVLKARIERNQDTLGAEHSALQANREQINDLARSRNIERYNEAVLDFNARVDNYNTLVSETEQIIREYNELVETRNELAVEVQQLVKAIDSRPQTFTD